MINKILILALSLYSLISYAQVEGELLGTWSDPSLVGSTAFNNTYNECWGLFVNDREIAIIGSTAGTHFIDVTDPTNPQEIQFVEGAVNTAQIIHRDYHDHKGYLYIVADEGNSTLQIVDISNLPDAIEVVYDSRELIRTAHNIFIDTVTDRLYGLISRNASGGAPMVMFDISDPVNPQMVESYFSFGGFNVSQVHDGYIDNNIAYLNCGPSGLAIVDMEDPAQPILLNGIRTGEYPQSGYNHSGWPTADGSQYYMADETWGMDIKVFDTTDPTEIEVIDTIDAGNPDPFSIPHNLIVRGNHMYASYYYDGLQVYNIEDPENIERIMYYPTSTIAPRNNYEGAWGVYPFLPSGNILVSDMQNGLFVIQGVHDPVSTQNLILDTRLNIFPNPSIDEITIEIPGQFQGKSLTCTINGIDGKEMEIYNINNVQSEIQIQHQLKTGHYVLKLSDGDFHFTESMFVK